MSACIYPGCTQPVTGETMDYSVDVPVLVPVCDEHAGPQIEVEPIALDGRVFAIHDSRVWS
jgi:hypothetical protein